jgi:hypothetical protein
MKLLGSHTTTKRTNGRQEYEFWWPCKEAVFLVWEKYKETVVDWGCWHAVGDEGAEIAVGTRDIAWRLVRARREHSACEAITRLVACFLTGILLSLFYPEDGGNMLLRNVGWLSADYKVLYLRRWYTSDNVSSTGCSLLVNIFSPPHGLQDPDRVFCENPLHLGHRAKHPHMTVRSTENGFPGNCLQKCILYLRRDLPSLLKTEFILNNIYSVRTSQKTHCVSAAKTSRLMLFKETVAAYCENHTQHTN